jgi:hypothetical protein
MRWYVVIGIVLIWFIIPATVKACSKAEFHRMRDGLHKNMEDYRSR